MHILLNKTHASILELRTSRNTFHVIRYPSFTWKFTPREMFIVASSSRRPLSVENGKRAVWSGPTINLSHMSNGVLIGEVNFWHGISKPEQKHTIRHGMGKVVPRVYQHPAKLDINYLDYSFVAYRDSIFRVPKILILGPGVYFTADRHGT